MLIQIPHDKQDKRPLERLQKLAEERDRSVNYLAVQAIVEYLEKESNKKLTPS